MKTTTHTDGSWEVTVSTPVKGTRQDRWTVEGIDTLTILVNEVKWGDTVLLVDQTIQYDWVDMVTAEYCFLYWDRVVYEDLVVEEVRKELADVISSAIEARVDNAVDGQVEYNTEHCDSLQDYCDAMTEELGYLIHTEKARLIAYVVEGWEVTESQAWKAVEAVDRYDCEGRYSGGYSEPRYTDCLRLNSWVAGEVEIDLGYVFQGVSRKEVKKVVGNEYAYGGADGAFHAVVSDDVLTDKVNEVIDTELEELADQIV